MPLERNTKATNPVLPLPGKQGSYRTICKCAQFGVRKFESSITDPGGEAAKELGGIFFEFGIFRNRNSGSHFDSLRKKAKPSPSLVFMARIWRTSGGDSSQWACSRRKSKGKRPSRTITGKRGLGWGGGLVAKMTLKSASPTKSHKLSSL